MEFTGLGPGGPRHPGTGVDLRLLVFPHAGGRSLMFRERPGRFPPGRHVWALDAPGRGALPDMPPLTDGESLVARFLDRLGPETADDHTPYVFFGHSKGSLVAYGLIRRLPAEGLAPPVWLGISAFDAPQPGDEAAPLPDDAPSDDESRHRPGVFGETPAQVLPDPHPRTVFAPAIHADLAVPRDLRAAPATAPLPVAQPAHLGAHHRPGRPPPRHPRARPPQ
ncbi:thioesterase II family protein, partial [Streptomyces sp. NPDC005009]